MTHLCILSLFVRRSMPCAIALRALLMVLAVGPPVLAVAWFLVQSVPGAAVLALVCCFIASLFLTPVERSRID
jgi:hypothetical protein